MPPTSVAATTKGWMPEATRIPVPAANFSVGNRGRKAAVLHLTIGSAASVRAEFTDATKRKSAHFLALKTGEIWQFVSVIDTAYANGLSWNVNQKCWVDPEGNLLKPPHAPAWPGLTPPVNPNFQTVSVERELLSPSETPLAAQDAAVVRILQFVRLQFPTLIPSWIPLQTLIGHCHISPIVRANCPGPKCNYDAFAQQANMAPHTWRLKGLPIYQRQDLTGKVAGYISDDMPHAIDVLYPNRAGHLMDGSGFIDMNGMEPL